MSESPPCKGGQVRPLDDLGGRISHARAVRWVGSEAGCVPWTRPAATVDAVSSRRTGGRMDVVGLWARNRLVAHARNRSVAPPVCLAIHPSVNPSTRYCLWNCRNPRSPSPSPYLAAVPVSRYPSPNRIPPSSCPHILSLPLFPLFPGDPRRPLISPFRQRRGR